MEPIFDVLQTFNEARIHGRRPSQGRRKIMSVRGAFNYTDLSILNSKDRGWGPASS